MITKFESYGDNEFKLPYKVGDYAIFRYLYDTKESNGFTPLVKDSKKLNEFLTTHIGRISEISIDYSNVLHHKFIYVEYSYYNIPDDIKMYFKDTCRAFIKGEILGWGGGKLYYAETRKELQEILDANKFGI